MARVDKDHFNEDSAYFQGMEDAVTMIKSIFELDKDTRAKYYGSERVSQIIDRFDFSQLHQLYQRQKHEEIKEIRRYYVIRGIQVDKHGYKKVIAESNRLRFVPDEDMINAFLEVNSDVDFASVEEIFIRE